MKATTMTSPRSALATTPDRRVRTPLLRAEAEYQEAGYDQTQRITTAGTHTDYDIPAIVADRLAELGK